MALSVLLLAGDSLEYHNGSPFSTHDRESSMLKCALRRHGAWWYKKCLNSNLNGGYGEFAGLEFNVWQDWLGIVGLRGSVMMIRPADYNNRECTLHLKYFDA